MGLFGGGKPEVSVKLDRSEILAGTPLRVHASFGAADKKTQGARIELLYRNTYKRDETDSDGRTSTSKVTSDVVVATHPVDLAGGGLSAGVEAELLVPEDAPPTAAGLVEWQVRAIVDRKLARDARAVEPLRVLSPATANADWAASPPEPSVAWPLTLELSTRTVRAGASISGHLRFTPSEAIKASSVRVQLRRVRQDPDSNGDSDDKTTRVELLGKGELAAGMPQDLPFELRVPADASPTFHARHNQQHWYVQGVIDVARARDPHVTTEIAVHTG